MTTKQVLSFIFLTAAGLLVCGNLQGFQEPVPVVDFATGLAGAGGTLSWAGGDAPLVGTDIRIGVVTGVGTPASKPATPIGPTPPGWGTLNFTTGPHVDFNPTTGVHTFRGDGNITISGSAPEAGIQDSVTLLSGTFFGATIGPNGRVNLGTADGQGSTNSALLSYFGLPDVSSDVNMFFTTAGLSASDAGFVRSVLSTEVATTVSRRCRYTITAVPATCQMGTPPPVGSTLCTGCPGSCPMLPGGGTGTTSSCVIKQTELRGTITVLCRVTLTKAPVSSMCQNGTCSNLNDFRGEIDVNTCQQPQ